jgi:uncharacterized protein YdeI (YjbR/CyaY-like superfamily)
MPVKKWPKLLWIFRRGECMKIDQTINKFFHSTHTNQVANNPQNSSTVQKKQTSPGIINKVNIPKDYQPKLTLNQEERQFFEQLYPRDKKRINQYLLHQNKIQVEKGKIVDFKG